MLGQSQSNVLKIFYDMKQTLTSALVLSVTSIRNSHFPALLPPNKKFIIFKSTVAPKLSILDMNTYCFPCKIKQL